MGEGEVNVLECFVKDWPEQGRNGEIDNVYDFLQYHSIVQLFQLSLLDQIAYLPNPFQILREVLSKLYPAVKACTASSALCLIVSTSDFKRAESIHLQLQALQESSTTPCFSLQSPILTDLGNILFLLPYREA